MKRLVISESEKKRILSLHKSKINLRESFQPFDETFLNSLPELLKTQIDQILNSEEGQKFVGCMIEKIKMEDIQKIFECSSCVEFMLNAINSKIDPTGIMNCKKELQPKFDQTTISTNFQYVVSCFGSSLGLSDDILKPINDAIPGVTNLAGAAIDAFGNFMGSFGGQK